MGVRVYVRMPSASPLRLNRTGSDLLASPDPSHTVLQKLVPMHNRTIWCHACLSANDDVVVNLILGYLGGLVSGISAYFFGGSNGKK